MSARAHTRVRPYIFYQNDGFLKGGGNDDKSGLFVQAEDNVHVLDSLTCRALYHVVDRRARNELAGALVVVDGNVAEV